jgi:NAD(P)-dependent dehydrogenase (short-subunit alcohol dehydrogenase family)
MSTFLIVGASRGLGDALNRQLPRAGDAAVLVSHNEPHLGEEDGVARDWIAADLARLDSGAEVARQLAGRRIDIVVYNAGIWERDAWSPAYDVTAVSDEETARIIAVNLTGAITLVSKLLPNLLQSDNPKVISIGSINGIASTPDGGVAYSASKFGMRGMVHALRAHWRKHRIGVSVLNPGTFGEGAVTHADLVASVRYVVDLSRGACAKEIDLLAMEDSD